MYVSHSFSLSFGLFDCDNYPSINAPCVQMLDGLSLHGESDCVKTVLPPQPLVKCFVPQAGPRVSELRSRTITVKHPWTNGTFWHWWMTGSFIWEFRLNGAGADAVQITSLMTHSSLTNFWISARSVGVWHSTRFATIPHRLPNKEPSWPSDGWIISAPGWQLQQIHPLIPSTLPSKYWTNILELVLIWLGKVFSSFSLNGYLICESFFFPP